MRLSYPPRFYEGLDYLDPILADYAPTTARGEAYCTAILGKTNFDSLRSQASKWTIPVRVHQRIGLTRKDPQGDYEESVKTNYARLATLGYQKQVQELADRYKGTDFTSRFWILYLTKAAPCFRALDGIAVMPKGDIQPVSGVDSFPVELGRILLKTVGLGRAENLDDAMQMHSECQRLRETLRMLDDAIGTGQAESLIEEKVFAFSKEADKMRREKENVKELIVTLAESSVPSLIGAATAGPAGAVVGLAGGLLAHQGFRIERIEKQADKIAERMAKFRKPSHIIALYDLKESVKRKRAAQSR